LPVNQLPAWVFQEGEDKEQRAPCSIEQETGNGNSDQSIDD
jgi:hypothetical protein